MMRYGAIYVAHNPRDGDNIFKVGKTERAVDERMKELSSATSNLGTYTAHAYFIVNDIDSAEEACHRRLHRYRVQDNREFFQLPLSRLVRIVKEEVKQYAAENFQPEIEQDESSAGASLSAKEALKSARERLSQTEKSWDEALAIAIRTISEWSSQIRHRALQVAAELQHEDTLKWEISDQAVPRHLPLCSVTVMCRFSKEPLALWRTGLRGGIYGGLDLSRAVGEPEVQNWHECEYVKWKELDDGRVGRLQLFAAIEHAYPFDREEGVAPCPKVVVRATPLRYDDYHQEFEEKTFWDKSYDDPNEAFEVFLALVVENAKTTQFDVREQSGFPEKQDPAQPRIYDGGKFEMGLLKD